MPALGGGGSANEGPQGGAPIPRGEEGGPVSFREPGPKKEKGYLFDPFLPNAMFGQNKRVNVSSLTVGCITVGCQPRGTYTGKRCRRHPRAPSRARRHARRAMAPASVAQDPLSGPAALSGLRESWRDPHGNPDGRKTEGRRAREKPQGWSASLALPFARGLAPTPDFWRLRSPAGTSQKSNPAHPIHAGG